MITQRLYGLYRQARKGNAAYWERLRSLEAYPANKCVSQFGKELANAPIRKEELAIRPLSNTEVAAHRGILRALSLLS